MAVRSQVSRAVEVRPGLVVVPLLQPNEAAVVVPPPHVRPECDCCGVACGRIGVLREAVVAGTQRHVRQVRTGVEFDGPGEEVERIAVATAGQRLRPGQEVVPARPEWDRTGPRRRLLGVARLPLPAEQRCPLFPDRSWRLIACNQFGELTHPNCPLQLFSLVLPGPGEQPVAACQQHTPFRQSTTDSLLLVRGERPKCRAAVPRFVLRQSVASECGLALRNPGPDLRRVIHPGVER